MVTTTGCDYLVLIRLDVPQGRIPGLHQRAVIMLFAFTEKREQMNNSLAVQYGTYLVVNMNLFWGNEP